MSFIYPNSNPPFSHNPQFINIPYPNLYYQMQNLTASYIKSRIIQKNLVYLIGLSSELVKIEQKLKSFEYFGQYGKIIKLVVNKNKIYNSNGPNGPSYTCFVTYSTEAESSLAILSLDNTIIDNHEIKANYGTTKYCMNFIKNWECKNKECIYLHKFADEKDIVSREIMNTDKDIFPQQRLMAIELSRILTNEKYSQLFKSKNIKTVFPNGFSVYTKDLVIKYIREKKLGVALNLNYSELTIEKDFSKLKNKNKKEENEKNKEDEKIKEDEKNKEEQTIKIKKKSMVSNCNDLLKHLIDVKHSLNYLYRCAPKSRFNFANGNNNLTGKEICQIIPSKINDFITQQFVRHSFFYQDKQNNINDIYFSLNSHSLDSDDSWSSLISIINKYNNKEEYDTIKKFNTQ